jgi:pyridoxal 5'-phosphate synthase pdxS subunit
VLAQDDRRPRLAAIEPRRELGGQLARHEADRLAAGEHFDRIRVVRVVRVAAQRERGTGLDGRPVDGVGAVPRSREAGDAQAARGELGRVTREVAAVVVDRREAGDPHLAAVVGVPIALLEHGCHDHSPQYPPSRMRDEATFRVKAGLAEMLKGGVIMDVVDAEQAKIAEDAGAAAVMALERVPADIRRDGGVARMSDPLLIKQIQEAVTIPVMAKARIGHFVEAQVLEALEIDYVDESEVLTPADEVNHIDKWQFKVPFVCGATNLGEALRRIAEGAAMIRSKGEAGTGDIVEAVRHMRRITTEIKRLTVMDETELASAAKEHQAPIDLVRQVARDGKLPVVLFCAGGIATPADAALMMQLGAEGNFVGSGIFKSSDPATRAAAIVEATTHFADAARVARASEGLGTAMSSLETRKLDEAQLLANRGW